MIVSADAVTHCVETAAAMPAPLCYDASTVNLLVLAICRLNFLISPVAIVVTTHCMATANADATPLHGNVVAVKTVAAAILLLPRLRRRCHCAITLLPSTLALQQ